MISFDSYGYLGDRLFRGNYLGRKTWMSRWSSFAKTINNSKISLRQRVGL